MTYKVHHQGCYKKYAIEGHGWEFTCHVIIFHLVDIIIFHLANFIIFHLAGFLHFSPELHILMQIYLSFCPRSETLCSAAFFYVTKCVVMYRVTLQITIPYCSIQFNPSNNYSIMFAKILD